MTATQPRVVSVDIHAFRTPTSMNERTHHMVMHREKKSWEYDLGMLLLSARFPKGLAFVEASAVLRFPYRRRRDAGNYWLLDKALGDVLQRGWIVDDTPEFYLWAGVSFDETPGPKRTTVTLVGRRA